MRWGKKMPTAADCCEECQNMERCTLWVYCDYASCGDKRGECWLKNLADPFTDVDLIQGRSDSWTSGTRQPPPPQAAQAGRASPLGAEAHLALVTELGSIRLRLRPKSPKAVAWIEGLLANHLDCAGCTFYRAEPVPKHWGSPDWPRSGTGSHIPLASANCTPKHTQCFIGFQCPRAAAAGSQSLA